MRAADTLRDLRERMAFGLPIDEYLRVNVPKQLQDQFIIDELFKVLGAGTYGVVFRCRDKRSATADGKPRIVAVKEIRIDNQEQKTLAMQEIRVLQRAIRTGAHPNVIRFRREFVPRDENYVGWINVPPMSGLNSPLYLVTDYISDKNLREWARDNVGRNNPVGYKLLPLMVRAGFDGLSYLHAHGIAHRDIKPSNIIVRNPNSPNATPVIVDVGLSCLTDEKDNCPDTEAGGTEQYNSIYRFFPNSAESPEVLRRADVWAMAASMWELAHGGRFFFAFIYDKVVPTNESLNRKIFRIFTNQGFSSRFAEALYRSLVGNVPLAQESAVLKLRQGQVPTLKDLGDKEVPRIPAQVAMTLFSSLIIDFTQPLAYGPNPFYGTRLSVSAVLQEFDRYSDLIRRSQGDPGPIVLKRPDNTGSVPSFSTPQKTPVQQVQNRMATDETLPDSPVQRCGDAGIITVFSFRTK